MAVQLHKKLKFDFNYEFEDIRLLKKPIPTYTPSDEAWGKEWMWHLENIEAEKAWNITHGNSLVRIAIIDEWFDPTHPDLENQLVYDYDPYPYSSTTFNDKCCDIHGTAVASCAAAETDGGGELAAIGFDVSIVPFEWENGLAKALYASNVLEVDVISISWFNSCIPDASGDDQTIINEIIDNGTIIIASAGNGYQGASCSANNDNKPPFTPLYPFSPTYDDRLICVSSTDRYDNHQYIENGNELTHSYYSEVDICAPGYRIGIADATQENNCPNNIDCNWSCCIEDTWPYIKGGIGTSFATPIVAGTCGLMKSVNSSITPAQAQEILKMTADPINDEYLYQGMLGAGRINAHCAVSRAAPTFINPITWWYTGGNIPFDCTIKDYFVNFNDVLIYNNADVIVKAAEVEINGEFEVAIGSSFKIEKPSSFTCE